MNATCLRRLAELGLDWLSPRQCALCELPAAEPVCEGCVAELPQSTARCRQCAAVMPVAGVCGRCLLLPPSHLGLLCGFDYRFPLDVLLSRFKYDADLTLLPAVFQLLDSVVARLTHARGLLVPIPLHPRRERRRGFNQSLLMARYLASRCELQLATGVLARSRDTRPQAELPVDVRHENMIGAFSVAGDIRGIRVWLLDDVVTTGATMESASSALLDAGAHSVNALALLRTVG